MRRGSVRGVCQSSRYLQYSLHDAALGSNHIEQFPFESCVITVVDHVLHVALENQAHEPSALPARIRQIASAHLLPAFLARGPRRLHPRDKFQECRYVAHFAAFDAVQCRVTDTDTWRQVAP